MLTRLTLPDAYCNDSFPKHAGEISALINLARTLGGFAIAYYHLYKGRLFSSVGRSIMTITHMFIMVVGLFLLGPGLYAAVKAIMADYSGSTRPAFSCKNLSLLSSLVQLKI